MTRVELALEEYGSATMAISPSAARDLPEVAGPRLSVRLGSEPGAYVITATQWVGSVVTSEVILLVRPKVPLHNLFALLDVGLPEEAWRIDPFSYAAERHLLSAFADLFARSAERALARGVRCDYRAVSERLTALRGRIDFPIQLRSPGLEVPVACAFDEYTQDIAENRVLRAAVRHLLRVPGVRPDTRRALTLLATRLEDVTDAWVDPATIDTIPISRLNRHYRPALRLAQLVLQNLTLIDRIGATDASAFMLDMNLLFERWVTDRLRRYVRGWLTVRDQVPWWLDYEHRVPVRPDLVFLAEGRVMGVADIKYKVTETGPGRTSVYRPPGCRILQSLPEPAAALASTTSHTCKSDGSGSAAWSTWEPPSACRGAHSARSSRTSPGHSATTSPHPRGSGGRAQSHPCRCRHGLIERLGRDEQPPALSVPPPLSFGRVRCAASPERSDHCRPEGLPGARAGARSRRDKPGPRVASFKRVRPQMGESVCAVRRSRRRERDGRRR